MGGQGLRSASLHAILNANYMAKRLEDGGYCIVYKVYMINNYLIIIIILG